MEIKITQKDLKKHDISYSDSGLVIDELAYCAGEYTYDEMYVNNLDDEPNEPYIYNYETDLFEQTKTREELNNIIELLGLGIPIGLSVHNQSNIQAGAQFALNAPEIWAEILEAYTQKLKENGTYNNISISKKYDIAIAKERSSYHQDMYREWLYGDRQYYAGIIYEIAKKFTNTRKSEYNEKKDTYTFFLDECDIEDAKYQGYNKNQCRRYLLTMISTAGFARYQEEKELQKKRREEKERIEQYQKERKIKEEQERKEKLLAMTIA